MAYLKENDIARSKKVLIDLLATGIDSKHTQLGKALQLWSENKTEQALEVVDNLLLDNPNFPEALEYQGYFLFSVGRADESAQSFNSYLNIHPQANQIRLRYMMSLAKASKFEAAEEQADYLLEISPINPLVNQVKAQSRLIEAEYILAKKFAEIALKSQDDLIGASIVAGYSSYKLGQLEIAYSHLKKIKNRLSMQHPARRLLSAISIEIGYVDESYEDINNAPNDDLDVELLSITSSQLFKQGEIEKAGHLLERAQELDPLNSQLAYQRGLLKMAENDPESIRFFEQAIKNDPEFSQAISLLVMDHLKKSNFDKALEIARSAAASNFVLSKTLEGVTFKMQGDLKSAEQAFNDVLSKDQENVLALFNLGNIAESNSNFEAAVELYKKALMVDGTNAPAINAIYRIGQNDKHNVLIDKQLTDLAENKMYSPEVSIILAGFYMRDDKHEQAKSVLSKSLQRHPDDFSLNIVQAKVLALLGKGELALEKLDRMIFTFPQALQARKLKVAILNARRNNFETIQAQELIVKEALGGEDEVLNLAFLYLQNNNVEKARQLLTDLPDMSSTSPKYNVIMGKFSISKADFSQAIRYLKQSYEQVPSAPILLDLVYAMQKLNMSDEALALILAFEENNELTVELMLQQAELYSLKEPEKALAIYEHLANKTNGHYVMLNNIAYVLMLQNKLEEALSYSKRALAKAEKVPAVNNTHGLILFEKGNISEAIKYLQKAYETDLTNHNYLVHYIQALFADKNYSLVDKLLIKIDKNMLNSDSLKRLATINLD